jgi:DNA-directed RNA polymerase alpha subunit
MGLVTELYPALELPHDTPISHVRFPARIRNTLIEAGVMTVGEIREMTDRQLLSLQGFEKSSLAPFGVADFSGFVDIRARQAHVGG